MCMCTGGAQGGAHGAQGGAQRCPEGAQVVHGGVRSGAQEVRSGGARGARWCAAVRSQCTGGRTTEFFFGGLLALFGV